jgi:AraC-like DNA-binding protein
MKREAFALDEQHEDRRWNPEVAGSRLRDLDQLVSPMLVTSFEWRSSSMPKMHQHRPAQLVFSGENVVTVRTKHMRIVVPPNRGVWVPPNVPHETTGNRVLHMHSVFVHPDQIHGMPGECVAVAISPLLRALIFHAAGRTESIQPDTPEHRLALVIFDQLRVAPHVSLNLPMPSDRRLLAVCEHLIQDPSSERTIPEWGAEVGASARTLSRLFLSETGMTFHHWRQQMRLQAALPRLADGESVTQIALDLGYQTPSAFIAMFRSVLGVTPKSYFTGGMPDEA